MRRCLRLGGIETLKGLPVVTVPRSRRFELAVGRDLQFVRINGTLVGALVGLAIYGLMQIWR